MTLWQGEFQIEASSESEVLDTFLRLPGWHKVRVTVRNINYTNLVTFIYQGRRLGQRV